MTFSNFHVFPMCCKNPFITNVRKKLQIIALMLMIMIMIMIIMINHDLKRNIPYGIQRKKLFFGLISKTTHIHAQEKKWMIFFVLLSILTTFAVQ